MKTELGDKCQVAFFPRSVFLTITQTKTLFCLPQFQQLVSSELKCLGRSSYTLCVNSPLVIRQALHPEASKKVAALRTPLSSVKLYSDFGAFSSAFCFAKKETKLLFYHYNFDSKTVVEN